MTVVNCEYMCIFGLCFADAVSKHNNRFRIPVLYSRLSYFSFSLDLLRKSPEFQFSLATADNFRLMADTHYAYVRPVDTGRTYG